MSFLHSIITLLLSTLAGLGVGSGGIFLLWLKEGMKIDGAVALLFNLCFFAAALAVATAIHARHRLLDFPFLLQIVLFGIPGTFLGRWINSFMPPVALRVLLGLFLVFSGIFSLVITKKPKERQKEPSDALDKTAKKYYNDKEL